LAQIKELEESMAALTAENEQLKGQLKDKEYKLESAEAEVKIHSVVKKSEADGAAATVQQLEKLLQQEMAKSHKLDLQLDQKQQQLVSRLHSGPLPTLLPTALRPTPWFTTPCSTPALPPVACRSQRSSRRAR
jgi:hypothetical protein